MSRLLIAIDQGGSKTELAVATTNGELLYRANDKHLRTCNYHDFESQRWQYIFKLTEESLEAVDATIADVDCMLAAVCGADWEEDIVRISNILSTIFGLASKKIIVINDCDAAFRACMPIALEMQNSAVIYAGTMFNCSIVSASNKSFTYGRLVNADDQGAYAIGYAVWRALIDSYNGFQEPTLMEKLFEELTETKSISEYIKDITTNSKNISPLSYAPILFKAVNENDRIASEIFDCFVKRWVKYVIAGAFKVGLTNNSSVRVYLSGGVFKNCPQLWYKRINDELARYSFNSSCYFANYEPIAGAMLLLLEKKYGNPLNNLMVNKIVDSKHFRSMKFKATY